MARKQTNNLAGMRRNKKGRPRGQTAPARAKTRGSREEEDILVEENEDDDDDGDDEEEYEETASAQQQETLASRDRPMTEDDERQELLNGLDDEARLQNQTANRVIDMRKNHARVPWHGQDGIKYNYGSEKCMTLFGSSSEVEISLEQPVAHHVGVIPLHQVPNWGKLSEYICNNQWDGTPQKYKIIMYSTGRSIAAVCYLKLGDNPKRRIEWRSIEAQARGVPQDQQQQAQPQQQSQQGQQQAQQQPRAQQQQWGDPQQQQQPSQPQWGDPQQQQPQRQEWQQPQPPGWFQAQLPSQQQPPQQWGQTQWPQQQQPSQQIPGWPQQMPWIQPPPPPQSQVEEEDDDEDEEEEFIEDIPPPPPGRMGQNPYQQPQPDYRILQLEGTIKGLNRQIKKLQKRNNYDMRSANTQASYQQQFQVWQMLSTLNGSLHSMKQQLEEAKAQAAMQQPAQQQQPQMMSMEEIARLVDEKLKATEAQQQQLQLQQQMAQWAQMGMSPPQQQQPPPPEPKDSLSEMRKTMKQMAELKEMFEKLSPSSPPVPPPPQMPQWMQQPPPQQALVQTETKAEDGSPLKVFEMGPFRYVTDKDGKAVDFFTMMALNADNVKSWIEPGIKALGELKQHVKDARRQEEMRDTYRMFEQMQQQLVENQQLQAQQIDMLSRRLAPSQSTVDALQSGNTVTVATPPPSPPPPPQQQPPTVSSPPPPTKPAWAEKKVPVQHGPSAKPVVSSGGSKSLLDGIAYAQRALSKTT